MSRLVVKVGGHALDSLEPTSSVLVDLAEDVAALRRGGTDVVLVHGGGPQIAELLVRLGLESRFSDGLRVTDSVTMTAVAMALSTVNLRVSAALNRAGLRCVGLSGADASLVRARSLGDPWDRAGTPEAINDDYLTQCWAASVTPVLSSVAVDEFGELLNCNADAVAGALAGAIDAEALILLSDVDQLRSDPQDPGSALARATANDVRDLLRTGAARDGMRPKMIAALEALDAGARRVVMANGTRDHALRDALAGQIPTTEVVR